MVEEKVREGYKRTEVGIIPEDWEVNYLNNMTELMTNGFVGTAKKHYTNNDNGILYIQGYNVKENSFNLHGIKRVSYEFHKKNSKSCLRENDLLTVQTGDVGLTTIVPKRLSNSNCHALIITRFKEQYLSKFYTFYLNSTIGRNRLKEIETGTTMKHINVGSLKWFSVPLPPLNEQKAIAEVLSDTDNLITSLQKLINKKEKIKKGAMQKLLTGQERLPGFDSEWEEKELGEICLIKKGKMITKRTVINGKIPVIAGGKKPAYFHNEANRLGKTITISASGANAGYVNFHKNPIFASDCSTISEENSYSIEFIYYFLKLNQLTIYNAQTGGAQPHIHPKDLSPLSINLPEFKEQKAIAQILSDMDSEIEALNKKLEKYKKIKQGMMEELLTGRIRLV